MSFFGGKADITRYVDVLLPSPTLCGDVIFSGLIQFCLDQGLREDETCLWGLPAVREDIP